MHGPGWVVVGFLLLTAATTSYCVGHLVRHRGARGPVDVELAEVVMGAAMIAMIAGAVPGGAARIVGATGFGAAAVWFVARRRPAPVPVGGPDVGVRAGTGRAQQAVLCVAMVAMLGVPGAAMSTMSMPAMAGAGPSLLVVALVGAVVVGLVACAGIDVRTLMRRRPATTTSRWPVACRLAMCTTSGWMLLSVLT